MPDMTFAHVPGMRAASQVAERHSGALSKDEFLSEYVAQSRPVVIREAVAHWPARTKWRDKDYLKRRSGHHRVFAYPHEYLNLTAVNESGQIGGIGTIDARLRAFLLNRVQTAPTAADDAYVASFQTSLTVPSPGVLANDYGSGISSMIAGWWPTR